MILQFKIFETWNDNTIDKSLFISGRAKHNAKVKGDRIEYKTDDNQYVATIKQIDSGKFLCKVYKLKDGGKIRIKKKYKKTLKTAHNFVREVLNDKIGNKKKKKKKEEDEPIDKFDKLFTDSPENNYSSEPSYDFDTEKKKPKTIIRRFR